jgi:hypothetical protein
MADFWQCQAVAQKKEPRREEREYPPAEPCSIETGQETSPPGRTSLPFVVDPERVENRLFVLGLRLNEQSVEIYSASARRFDELDRELHAFDGERPQDFLFRD